MASATTSFAQDAAAPQKPNIIIIWGDDIGQSNISAYSHGVMGYKTPNIDRVAREGMMFTDYYAEQSCTAGRASFLTGQSGLRTGLTKVGLPGAPVGLQKEDPTIAELLKAQGYATGQFGKNHLGDRNEFLPTVHGFDEFYGNLYHLNAEEEPELPDYPKDPAFRAQFGPRGVMDCKASASVDKTDDPRFGVDGQADLHGYRTADEGADGDDRRRRRRARHRLHQAPERGRHTRVRVDQLLAHAFPHAHEAREHRPVGPLAEPLPRHHDRPRQERGSDPRRDRRARDRRQQLRHVQHRQRPAHEQLARRCDDALPEREELELGRRLPGTAMVRWPGKIKPGQVSNEMVAHHDWLPTFLAIAGNDQVKDELMKGSKFGGPKFKVHLDGDNLVPYLTGQAEKSPRESFLYINDDQQLTGLRYDNWKFVFMEQRTEGTLRIWAEPFVNLRVPKLFNLRTDPVRASGHHVEYLLRLDARPHLPVRTGPGVRRQVPDELRGVPAAPEGGHVQHGRRDGDPGRDPEDRQVERTGRVART